MRLLERLLAHDRWATNTLFDTCASLSDEQFAQPFDIGHESIHATFGHLIFNIEFWTGSMSGAEIDHSNQDFSRTNLRRRWDRAFDAFETFALEIDRRALIDDTFFDHWEQPQTYGSAILHVILHDDEHRQEILHILNRLQVEIVPEIDLALWDFVRRGLAE